MQWSHLFRGEYDQVRALGPDVRRSLERCFILRLPAFSAPAWTYMFLGGWEPRWPKGGRAFTRSSPPGPAVGTRRYLTLNSGTAAARVAIRSAASLVASGMRSRIASRRYVAS